MLTLERITLPDASYEKYATIYSDTDITAKACILYFHGGGLLYGDREDLPPLHLDTFTQAGYIVIAFDYPLAPAAEIDMILEDVYASISHYIQHPELYTNTFLPYFLWGRSAGAYLCLMAAFKGDFKKHSLGVLSYYGYGFLCDYWFSTPNAYYLSLPPVSEPDVLKFAGSISAKGPISTHYSAYIYARQTGCWKNLLFTGRDKDFYLHYTLRTADTLPVPLFCAHSINDEDVPYSEFQSLTNQFSAQTFIVPGDIHDFDRDELSPFTEKVLTESLRFLNELVI